VQDFFELNEEHAPPSGDNDEDDAASATPAAGGRLDGAAAANESVLCLYRRPEWQRDEDAVQCPICEAEFTLLTRRRHCRRCGRCVCAACCADTLVKLPRLGYNTPVLVCKGCFVIAEEVAEESKAEDAALAANIRTKIQHMLRALFKEHAAASPLKIFVSPNIPLAKYKNAQKACAVPEDEIPCVLIGKKKKKKKTKRRSLTLPQSLFVFITGAFLIRLFVTFLYIVTAARCR
jgi:hypothetical protein